MMAVGCLWIISSCNQEMIQDNSHGYLGLCLESELPENLPTKSDEERIFSIEVLNSTGQLVTSVDNHLTITEDNPIVLRIGSYKLAAKSGLNLNAAFENPYYEGYTKENFRISPNKTTTVNLSCTLANTIVSVEFPSDFTDFTEYEVAVTNGVGDKLVFSNNPKFDNKLEAGFDSKAYFAVTGTLTWELYLKNTDGGEYRATETLTNVKAREHYKLKFSMGEDMTSDGGFSIKLNIINTWAESDHKLLLDFSQKSIPVIMNDFAAASGELVQSIIESTESKVLTFTASDGIRSISAKHSNNTLAEQGLSKEFEFVGASSLPTGIKTSGANEGSTKATVDITNFVAALPIGNYNIEFTVLDTKGKYNVFVLNLEVIAAVDAEATLAKTGWAAFAQLQGRLYETSKKDVVSFQYKKSSASDWTQIPFTEIEHNSSNSTFSAIIYGLEPSTSYDFRAVSDTDIETKVITFTTDSAPALYNFGFDSWSDNDKFPNESGVAIWDSANSSGATTTTSPVTDAISGKAARLESVTTFGMLAAGNIFTGDFIGLAGLGAELDWGTPFSSRPIAIRGYFKYAPKTIDYAKNPYTSMKGKTDQCQILCFLTDWDQPFTVNTNDKKFVDLDNDSGIIALGIFNTSETVSSYTQITIPLVYRSSSRMPTYLIFAGASSRYGDYFTGGKGSVLHLDEFELIYDPAELTDDEFKSVFSRVNPF